MTNKKCGRLLIAAGALVLCAAVSLVAYNRYTDKKAGEAAEKTAAVIREHIEAQTGQQNTDSGADSRAQDEGAETEAEELIPLDIDGELYLGLLEIPKLDLELPITKGWDYNKMHHALCQYSGDVRHSDLIICGHNYTSYLIDLDQLAVGDEIIFTEVNGRQHSYTVGWFELLGGLEGEKLDAGSDDWDLTVFTCTWSGYSRVVVRCQACTPGARRTALPLADYYSFVVK